MISLLSSLGKNTEPTILLEILDKKSINFYTNLGFPIELCNQCEINLWKKKDPEKTMTFYTSLFGAEKIIAFFPKKESLMDDRSEFLRNAPKKSIFVPSIEFLAAFEALSLSTYSYGRFLSKKEEKSYSLYIEKSFEKEIKEISPRIDATIRARDLINLPPTDSRPEELVKYIQEYPWKNFKLRIMDSEELKKLGCNLLLAVWAGSDYPPYMVVLERIGKNKLDTYALIGKWVTFDAGGIQIKPDTAMLDMKCDMSWAAGMLGVAEYLDTIDTLNCNVVVGLGFTENMTWGKAYKPLDIYKAYNGTTVEIHHTDAEWRLVLADVMSYVEKQYQPKHIITMATLTWACLYALGHDIAGIMGDDESVIEKLLNTDSPYEKVWRLPLNEKLKKSLKAEIADIKNVARSEKAGSSVGWAFLSYFQWKAKLTHLDIAGPAYRETTFGYMPKWWTGWWVKILSDLLLSSKKK